MSLFEDYKLKPIVLESINSIGFKKPTIIQNLVIPVALENKNLIGKGKTGSGKTHSFLIPISNKIQTSKQTLQCVILVPTRELAIQINKCCKDFFALQKDIKITCLTGGVDANRDLSKLSTTPHILIGTPERIKKLVIDNGSLNLSTVETFVIDEADMTLEMGFLNEVDRIASLIKKDAQIMVFSATIPAGIKAFMRKYLKKPVLLEDEKSNVHANIEHVLYPCRGKDKKEVLHTILQNINPYVCLIFANTKKEVEEVYKYLVNLDYPVEMIHGDLKSRERKRNIKRSLEGEFKYIVASDIASRGIDIAGVSHVISIGLPKNNLEFYMHRAGRCGRNNLDGTCITIFNNSDKEAINRLIGQKVEFKTKEIKNGEWKEIKDFNSRINRTKKVTELDLQIQKVVATNKNKKVKPNYKKKIRDQVDKLKRKHKREIIQKDIKKRQIARAIENSKKAGE